MNRRPAPTRQQRQNDGPGVPARRAALKLLDAVLRRGEPLELALHAAAQGLAGADRSLAHAIAADTLRHLVDLDSLIDSATREPLPDDAKARMVLRLALAQILLMQTPPHAAISTALPLVDGGPRRLVHGVLGHLVRSNVTLPDVPHLPPPVARRWEEQWGEDTANAARTVLGQRAPIDLTLAHLEETELWLNRLGGQSLAPGHIRLRHDVTIPDLPGYQEGAWWVQDIAASLPARMAGPGNGRTAIDLCAAPGGKTMQLATAGWHVTALDQSAKRLERLRQNLDRTRINADVAQADARIWQPGIRADLVLLDAPCSATGIFRRHPDVLHRVGERQIAEMAELQAQLLANAAKMVTPGGRLIYATCSLEKAEGEEQIARFLPDQPDFALEPIPPTVLLGGLREKEPGILRTLPGLWSEYGGADGFFIAILRRSA